MERTKKSALFSTDYLEYLGYDNRQPQAGDIFVYRPAKLKKYYYGLVVSNDAVHQTMQSQRKIHLQFFDYFTSEIESSPNLSSVRLLFPPILVRHTTDHKVTYDFEKSAWLSNYFSIVGSTDLAKIPSVTRAMFMDGNGWLYNASGEAIAYERLDETDADTFLGDFYHEGAEELMKWLISSLGLVKQTDPLAYYKKQLNEMRLRLQRSVLLCSGRCVEVKTPYNEQKINVYPLTVQTEPQWKRYIKQGGSEHYAVIQYQIKQRSDCQGILFRNLAAPEQEGQGNRHTERMFRAFVVMVYEGIQGFAERQYEEHNIAFGGIEICLQQLRLHPSDSKLIDFKIVGYMILAEYMKEKNV